MKIALFPNIYNSDVEMLTEQILGVLVGLGIDVEIARCNTDIDDITKPLFANQDELIRRNDVMIAVGGDGTTLNIAKSSALYGKMTLGINAGRLGFMSGLERDELNLLNCLSTGQYEVEERMMIKAEIIDANGNSQVHQCLNDAVLSRGDLARLIDISVTCEGRLVTDSRADGMIFSTPTGSTAYSMAAGGPVVSPDNSCVVATPICPHSLINRSIVFSPDKVLEISVSNDRNNNAYLSIDGKQSIPVDEKTKIIISKSEYTAKLIKIKPDNFYEILNKKLLERRI